MVTLAEQPPQGPAAFPVTANAYEVRATLDFGVVYDRLQAETTRLLEDFSQRGLTGQTLADAVTGSLQNLSDVPVDQAGRGGATEAFNLGRNLAMQEAAPQIDEVVRTAILDQNTCPPCDSLDGFTTTINGPGYFENMPPNKCDGWSLCRCFYMARAA